MSYLPTIVICFLVTSLLCRFYIFPLLFAHLSNFRLTSFSPLSFRGLEYRLQDDESSVVPTLRVERAAWAWGGFKQDIVKGLIVLKLEGVSFRVKRRAKRRPNETVTKAKAQPGRLASLRNRGLSSLLHLFIHHYPSFARLLSLQVGDVRIIFDDLDGLELTVRDLHFGVKVIFEGDVEVPESEAPSPVLGVGSPDSKRAYPLASPPPETGDLASPLSPNGFFTSFSFPLPPAASEPRPSRMASARKRASHFQSRVSSTANTVWQRAIARAHGSVIFMSTITDVALILPHHDSVPDRSSWIAPDRAPTPHPHVSGLSQRPSCRSLASETSTRERPKSFVSVKPIHKLLNPTPPRYALPCAEGGYERLFVVDGTSAASLGLGFGPKKGLLGEDTLRTDLTWDKVHTSLGAIEKVNDMIKEHRGVQQDTPAAKSRWSPRSMPRIILRAFESVSVSFYHLTVSHYLPASDYAARSAASSTTDVSDLLIVDDDNFTVSLEVSDISCQLNAADSSTNERTKNAFGTNSNPESKVRGVGFKLSWNSIGIQCIAPGEKADDKSQLFQMRSADFEGCSTWRPGGWSREELLFANDPNLALIVARGSIASVDVAADLPLMYDLKEAWQRSRPAVSGHPQKTAQVSEFFGLPPRIRVVLDVGHVMVLVADPSSDEKTTLTVESDGLHVGCFTSFFDVIARRNRTATKAAFKAEEELRSRREQSGLHEDYSQPSTMLKPRFRRHPSQSPAKLRDDYAISMRVDAQLELEPLSLHMTLCGEDPRNPQTHHLASIGRMHMTLGGDVLGKQDVLSDGSELSRLDPESRSFALDLGIDQGVKIDMWESAVISALITMANAHRPAVQSSVSSNKAPALDRMPCGLSVRLSLGLISIFIGHIDPNPKCKLGLVRGLWLQTQVTLEYAFYRNKVQALQCRHPLTSATRTKLRLPEDITTQALAHFYELSPSQGNAALFACTLADSFVKPIFNGERFVDAGGIYLSHEVAKSPKPRLTDDFVGWEFLRPRVETDLNEGKFANGLPPLEMEDTEQASRPLLRIPHATVQCLFKAEKPDSELVYELSGDIDGAEVVADLSHIYCAMLAALVIRQISAAVRHPDRKPRDGSTLTKQLTLNFTLSYLNMHMVFPAGEHSVLYAKSLKVARRVDNPIHCRSEIILMYVPSPRERGSFEELARLRSLDLQVDQRGPKPDFNIDGDALRLRIPFGYVFSRLVLNIQMAAKSLKLLMIDLGSTDEFAFIRRPEAEQPKRLPKMTFNIRYASLEAKDNPIETRLNLIWRVGMNEQPLRNAWEDMFERKQHMVEESGGSFDDVNENDLRSAHTRLTHTSTVSYEDARYRLDWFKSQEWRKRIDNAVKVQRRREVEALRSMENIGPDRKLPIRIAAPTQSAPLFRAAFEGVVMSVEDVGWSREKIIEYMGEVSTPFDKDTEFSLMVPLKLSWSMNSATCKLRDYPLDLIKVPPSKDHSPSWQLETPIIIAEELQGPDSVVYLPTRVIPEHCGARDAAPFIVQVAKTIMPVKTYARPVINISSERTTEFTWGNSYQPAIQDFMKVVESLSHPPRDPSPRVGFWDKFRLILHWRVTVNFEGPVHLHLKGTLDPYITQGFGSGFALSWSGDTKLEINQPNEQYETIQITADELLIAIPDLTGVQDGEAIGREEEKDPNKAPHRAHHDLIERRYTKPCAVYQNGVRVGFGFVLERTCRKWNCTKGCGSTDKLLHRQCRMIGDFKKHQEVILRSPEAVERDDKEAGRATDSYEGFRSDWIHFSVSCVSPLKEVDPKEQDSNKLTGLHFSPKAFAHFFAWWKLFDSSTSLPIRQGKLFPDSPPPSKKFGRSLATIKYRFDLAQVYVSHIYYQVAPELWAQGKSQALGVKARFGRFRADLHQRAQEKVVRHEKLHRTSVVVHKPFYAADLLLEDAELKTVRATFASPWKDAECPETPPLHPKASDLDPEDGAWYNFFDFIDADQKPFDRNPQVEIVNVGDCPQIFFSKRVKVRQTTPNDDDNSSLGSSSDSRMELESSKFGHERSHICYLGAAAGVGPTQVRITKDRIRQLEDIKAQLIHDHPESPDLRDVNGRLKSLKTHLQELSSKESRHIDDDTFQSTYIHPLDQESHGTGDVTFENTFHVHCPRLILTNTARNLLYKYYFSSRDRKREEYFTSHESLRSIRDNYFKRMSRMDKGPFGDHMGNDTPNRDADEGLDILRDLQSKLQGSRASKWFEIPYSDASGDEELRKPTIGLPEDCVVKPQNTFLLLKPQIALRSDVDDDSIVLLAMEETSLKGYRVFDQSTSDSIMSNVLDRNFVSMKGLQAFYPNERTMRQERGPLGVPRGLDFVPLEIFLDVRSEATDYDRIVLKADAAIQHDRFNHLRMPRGLDWPVVKDQDGNPINHLRLHQDLLTVIVPRLSVAATSKHYTALFNVVTDLLLYTDPEHRKRAERIDNFIYAFDRKDRDPQRLILELFNLQQEIRSLAALERGYANNVDRLSETGKHELFQIRTDHLEGMEQLFTVFEAVAVNQARDDAKAELKTASRMDARVGGIAWHMLRDDMTPLIKLDMESTMYSLVSNKDGSTDNAAVFGDVSALNSDSDALYPEVLMRYEPSGLSRRRYKESFASIFMSTLAPVGGIQIVRHLAVYLHPLRFKLEERLGHEIVDYVFNDRVKRRRQKLEKEQTNGHANGNATPSVHGRKEVMRTASGMEMPPLKRSKSQASVMTDSNTPRTSEDAGDGDNKFTMVPIKDAAEMRRRATENKTFVKIVFAATSIVLSYKTDEKKKHRTFSIPDCVDFKFKTPEIVYGNKVWGYEDVFEHWKRDTRSYAWSQTGDLLSQLFKKTSVFRSKKTLKQIATLSPEPLLRETISRVPTMSSKLRYTVEPPTPSDDVQNTMGIARALSREHREPSQPLSRSVSGEVNHASGSQQSHIMGGPISSAPDHISDEDEDSDDHPGVGKTMKGLLGKLRSRHSGRHERRDSGSIQGSTDDLSRTASSDRSRVKHSPSISSSSSSYHHTHML